MTASRMIPSKHLIAFLMMKHCKSAVYLASSLAVEFLHPKIHHHAFCRYRTARCYFLGEAYYERKKWSEATKLFLHASILCSNAISREKAFVPLSNGIEDESGSEKRLKKLSNLQPLISGASVRTKAKSYLDNNESTATMCPMIDGSETNDDALSFVSERLGTYSCAPASEGFGIAPFPPRIEPAIAHPLLLDTALDFLPCPQFKKEAGLHDVSQDRQDSGMMNWLKFW
eukprot:325277_1